MITRRGKEYNCICEEKKTMKSKKINVFLDKMNFVCRKKCCHPWWVVAVLTLAIFTLYIQMSRDMDWFSSEENSLQYRMLGPIDAKDPRLLSLLRNRYLSPPSPLPYNLSTDPDYKVVKNYGSWGSIHRQITKLFKGQKGGFFVEAGALDGESISNTLWLEKKMGWSGLLIEPSPENFQTLVNKRRKAWTSHSCLSPEPYPKEHIMVSLVRKKKKERDIDRMINDHRGSSHLLGIELDTHIYDSLQTLSDTSYSVVQCFPLISYLLSLNVTTVDLLSLDIQGAEKDVLQNFPWDDVTIRVLVVEVVHHETFDQEFVDYLRSKKFNLVSFEGEDYIFVKAGDAIWKNVDKVTIVVNDKTKQKSV